MKPYRIITLSAALAVTSLISSANPSAVSLASEPSDTILSVNNANQVTITENAKGVTLNIKGTEEDPDFVTTFNAEYTPNATVKIKQRFSSALIPQAKAAYESRDAIEFLNGLHAGFVTMLGAPEGMDVEMGKSFEIGIDQIIGYKITSRRQPGGLSIGLGINWRNYRMTRNTRFIIDGDNRLSTAPFPEGTTGSYSRLKVFSLSFPVTYQFNTRIRAIAGVPMSFTIGAILNWNSHSSLLSSWQDDATGQRVKQSFNDIGQRKFTVDLLATWRVAPQTGLYVRYSPMKFFKDGCGPDVSAISTGIYIGF